MRLRDRGMVKWAPFKSLPEQEEYLLSMEEKEDVVERPELSEDALDELDRTVTNLLKGNVVVVSYYDDFHIKDFEGVVDQVDELHRRLLFENGKVICVKDICSLKRM